ncbi:hypothetical protein BN134_2217 [Cronobacter dublinensis 1210]|uniref:Uncharacterized protein n=1 Tax=Cronobacter dublinensis 1210 TaxID=1208656 RepID=A0ABP1W8T8_9ENTR|nr:hypothetical protein BN134_2217 [Cronobacter dublinensis 1210]CCJ85951.1 hypothetical protein BN133_2328 [Cronobacter dublinensis 582]
MFIRNLCIFILLLSHAQVAILWRHRVINAKTFAERQLFTLL